MGFLLFETFSIELDNMYSAYKTALNMIQVLICSMLTLISGSLFVIILVIRTCPSPFICLTEFFSECFLDANSAVFFCRNRYEGSCKVIKKIFVFAWTVLAQNLSCFLLAVFLFWDLFIVLLAFYRHEARVNRHLFLAFLLISLVKFEVASPIESILFSDIRHKFNSKF